MNTRAKLSEAIDMVVFANEPLGKRTTLKVGGNAEYYLEIDTLDRLVEVIDVARSFGIPVTMLGGGSNVLISDKGIEGLVIKNVSQKIQIQGMTGHQSGGNHQGEVLLEVSSGVLMNALVRRTVEDGLSGLEMHLGLPGTVGGAVYMNSKWTHPVGCVGDVVESALIYTPESELKTVPKSYFSFDYDYSVLQKTGDILLTVLFRLTQAPKETLWSVANESIAYRRESQPQGVMSAGCTFQNLTDAEVMEFNIPGHQRSAGFLIDHVGLKGEIIGGAQISPVHGNFIINRGGATATDVVQLIERCRKKVFERFGVELREEIVRLGKFS